MKKTYWRKTYLDKARFWAKILGRLPGVEAIFLSGSLAQGKAKKSSDIDFFIIARPGQIWTARFSVFMVLKLCGQISTEARHQGKICPNHFIISDSLEIVEKDEYSAHLFSHNVPLWDPQKIFPEFVKANTWVWKYKYEFPLQIETGDPQSYQAPEPKVSWAENWLKHWQIKKIKANSDYHLPGAKIILNDTELRFHPKPRNKEFDPVEKPEPLEIVKFQ